MEGEICNHRGGRTDITFLLDRSGSMERIWEDTMGGFNGFVEEQKKQPGEAVLTLVQFNHEVWEKYVCVPLKDVERMTFKTYTPGGMTALLDALGATIVRTGERLKAMQESDRPAKVIFVIVTDGHENSSKEYTKQKVAEMVAHQQTIYSWNFVFLGANMNAFTEAGKVGVQDGNTYNFKSTKHGIGLAFKAVTCGMSAYRAGADVRTTNYFGGDTGSAPPPPPPPQQPQAVQPDVAVDLASGPDRQAVSVIKSNSSVKEVEITHYKTPLKDADLGLDLEDFGGSHAD